MQRQTDHDRGDFLRIHQSAEIRSITLAAARFIHGQRRREPALGIADGQTDAYRTEVHSKKSRSHAHRYFSSPFFFKRSTSCLTVPSSVRSAISVASPSCTITKFETPMVVMILPASPTMMQWFVFRPQCWASIVLWSAS